MTSAQVVETSVTNTEDILSQDYTHPDNKTTLLQKLKLQLLLPINAKSIKCVPHINCGKFQVPSKRHSMVFYSSILEGALCK